MTPAQYEKRIRELEDEVDKAKLLSGYVIYMETQHKLHETREMIKELLSLPIGITAFNVEQIVKFESLKEKLEAFAKEE